MLEVLIRLALLDGLVTVDDITLAFLSVIFLSEVDNTNRINILLVEEAEQASIILLLKFIALPWFNTAELRLLRSKLLLAFDHIFIINMILYAFAHALA